jgi:diguanylate cyclase (GGDEF)-like protein
MAIKFLKSFKSSAGEAAAPQQAAFSDDGTSSPLRAKILDEFERAGSVWVWATDADGKLVYLTDKAREALAADDAALLGQPFEAIFEADENGAQDGSGRSLTFQLKARSTIREQVVRFTIGRKDTDLRQTWWAISGHPVRDEAGNFTGYRGNAKDVTVEYERQLADSRMAEFDSLTGLANRHVIRRHLDGAISAYASTSRPCGLLMLDLDKFKYVNDTLGHQAGDALLVQVAERLTRIVGDRGKIARLGGDEFQVVLVGEDDRGRLGELADKIIQIISQPYALDDGRRAIIGASVGIAVFPFDGDDSEKLNRSADLALYAAKHSGRGQFRFYSSDLKNDEEVRHQLLEDLRDALAHGQLAMHYQPVVSVETGAVVCLEALMRWEHPEKGMISPVMFIPVAEESDLINPLGEWALRQACEAAQRWPETVKVAVNVSAKQFVNPGFPEVVANALAASGLAPERLELELTESVFVGDSDETEKTFAVLKRLGVRLALDDFGTGYSSLSYLRSAPFDKIKVDRSFVDSCTQKDRNSAKIIAAIVGLANALGMETTVEGVEAFDQLDVVREKGAQLIQGFLFARPMPEAEILGRFERGEYKIEPRGPEKFRPDRRSVFRRIGAIHEDYYYNVVMRDLSRTGAGIEGIVGVPVDTPLVLDLGDGQLVVGRVIYSHGDEVGVEFEAPLVNDGAGGLCTRHRVSAYMIAAAGLPKRPGTAGPSEGKRNESKPQFMEVSPGSGHT